MNKNNNWNRCPYCPMMWQPIKTAPDDGRDFLVIDSFYQQWICVKIDGRIIATGEKVIDMAKRIAKDATHWMPLPEPPK